MKKLVSVLVLSFFALTAASAFADGDKKCDAKAEKKSCAGKKCCAGDKAGEKKAAAKPADKTDSAKPAVAVKSAPSAS